MIVSYILSSLALLAAAANIILLCVGKKRDEARRTAMLQYIDNVCNGTLIAAEEIIDECYEALKKENEERAIILRNNMEERLTAMHEEVEKLKAGAVPDYEAAVAAANAVNEFNTGITSILNFDPIAVARARRQGDSKEAI